MNRYKSLLCIRLLWIIILTSPAVIRAFPVPESDSITEDSVTVNKTDSKHNLYAIGGVGYNLVYMGSSLSQDKPYYTAGLLYGFKSEFFVSAYTIHLNIYDPVFTFSTFSVNYSHTFNSWFDIAASASRYQVNKSLTDSLFSSFYYADLTLGFDWRLLYTKLTAGGLFSESNAAFFQLRNSRYFETSPILKGKGSVSFDPYVNLLFGTISETTEGRIVSPPYKKGKGRGNTVITTSYFGLMEIDFGLPVAFSAGRLTIEAEPGYALSFYKNTGETASDGFIFNLVCYFRII